MIVFHGGLTITQVKKFENGEFVIYDKIPYAKAYASSENTFDYVPKELYRAPIEEFKKYISEDIYINQYIFFARYLKTAMEFCNNTEKKNYIMVCDIEDTILNQYIGVGNYDDYRIEYRLPRRFIDLDKIIEFLYFEPYDQEQIENFKEKYKDFMAISPKEEEEAKKLMLHKNLIFNGKRNWKESI